jgi:hypothetical protein
MSKNLPLFSRAFAECRPCASPRVARKTCLFPEKRERNCGAKVVFFFESTKQSDKKDGRQPISAPPIVRLGEPLRRPKPLGSSKITPVAHNINVRTSAIIVSTRWSGLLRRSGSQ